MSHAATNWAIQQRGLKPTTKIVLWHLADRFNPDFGCFPSQGRLAHDCEISRSTLNAHLALLEAAGLLRRVPRIHPVTRRQMPTRYILGFEPGVTPPDPDPCPKSGHGNAARAVSDSEPDPCPKNARSRVRNPDTNPVREPLREPVKAQASAQAPDAAPDDLLAELLGALGFDADGPLPGLWQGAPPWAHLRRWREELGLSAAQIIRVARETRKEHPTPPDGPRALDRAMERAARRKSGIGSPASGPGESMCGRRSGKSALSRALPGAEAVTAFYAELVNSDRFLPASMISNTIRDLLLASGLVTADRLRARGIA